MVWVAWVTTQLPGSRFLPRSSTREWLRRLCVGLSGTLRLPLTARLPPPPAALRTDRVKKAVLKEALHQARWHFVNHVVPVLRRRQLQEQGRLLRIGLPEARRLVQANHKGAQSVTAGRPVWAWGSCAGACWQSAHRWWCLCRLARHTTPHRSFVIKHFHEAAMAARPKPVMFAMWRYFSPVRRARATRPLSSPYRVLMLTMGLWGLGWLGCCRVVPAGGNASPAGGGSRRHVSEAHPASGCVPWPGTSMLGLTCVCGAGAASLTRVVVTWRVQGWTPTKRTPAPF